MKTVSLELSKALKEAGYPQLKSDFHWVVTMTQPYHLSYTLSDPRLLPDHNDYVSSPTADEILDQLPVVTIRKGKELYYVSWIENTEIHVPVASYNKEADKILADAAAKMWLYLKKEGL